MWRVQQVPGFNYRASAPCLAQGEVLWWVQRSQGSWAPRNDSQLRQWSRVDLPIRLIPLALSCVQGEQTLPFGFRRPHYCYWKEHFGQRWTMFPFSCLGSYLEKGEVSEQGFLVMWWMTKDFAPCCNGPEKAAVTHVMLVTANGSWVWHPEKNIPLELCFPLWTNWHWGNLCHK